MWMQVWYLKKYGQKSLKWENLLILIHICIYKLVNTLSICCKSEKESHYLITMVRSMTWFVEQFPGALRIPSLFLWSNTHFASSQSWGLTPGLQSGARGKVGVGHSNVFSTVTPCGTFKVKGNILCPNYLVFLKCKSEFMRPTYHFMLTSDSGEVQNY